MHTAVQTVAGSGSISCTCWSREYSRGIAGDQGLPKRCMMGDRNEQTDDEMIQEEAEYHTEKWQILNTMRFEDTSQMRGGTLC